MLVLHRILHQSFGEQQGLIVIAEARRGIRGLHVIRLLFVAGLAFAGRVLPVNPAGAAVSSGTNSVSAAAVLTAWERAEIWSSVVAA